MYRRKIFNKNVLSATTNVLCTQSRAVSDDKCVRMGKVLVVSKLTRYEYEKVKNKHLSEKELMKKLTSRGVEIDNLMYYHSIHKDFEHNFIKTLWNMGCDVNVVNRFSYTEDSVKWADVVVPVGGDGTFLLAASKVLSNEKPVVGFNSDPRRSEGHLCLPKRYSTDISGAVQRLRAGEFEWLCRSRIRTKLVKYGGEIVCKSLHDMDYRNQEIRDAGTYTSRAQVIPVLALNEVFIGEVFSARVSNLKVRLDGSSEQTYVKCSGVCLSTGTGSTSWHMSINRMSAQDAADLLTLIDIEPIGGENSLATILSRIYNKNLTFPADDLRIGYTFRDKIVSVVWPKPRGIKTRGFVNKIEIHSNCYDGCLVVDGGVSFDFNDGTIAIFEICPEDALKTVTFKDS